MSPTRWERIADLFDRTADLEPADHAAFLDAEAVGTDGAPDRALREEVETLLAADIEDNYLTDRFVAKEASRPPPTAGRWDLVERIGQGGMGEVWRAERADDVELVAAVKLVRPGVGDRLLARFRTERQILSNLDHPAIARLVDGGTASDGRPYLATELVHGQPITASCDCRRLGVNERLELFVEVCEAVAYAHARLVVHRDLKPSNVMVTGEHRVKLLDFGIAKLLDADDDLTQTGRPLLTPSYAAPEQSAGGAVTTATDVYSLGVLLHELLTGTRPVPGGDATRPSDSVTTARRTAGRVPPSPAADAAEHNGALRSMTADRLRRRLRGDLDRIVLKALRADPDRRYRGAAELGADIQRHLDGLPVEARPESTAYRIGKFVRRNRGLVAATCLTLVAIVAAAAISTVQSQRVLHEQRLNATVSDYMLGLFRSSANPSAADSALTVAEVTARGARRVRIELADQPEAQAEVYRLIGEVYLSVGRVASADSLARQSVDLWESVGAGRSAAAARSRTVWGLALVERGRPAEAEAALRHALDDLLALGSPQRDDVADAKAALARAVAGQDRRAEALPLLRQVLATRRALHGEDSAEAEAARDALKRGIEARDRSAL